MIEGSVTTAASLYPRMRSTVIRNARRPRFLRRWQSVVICSAGPRDGVAVGYEEVPEVCCRVIHWKLPLKFRTWKRSSGMAWALWVTAMVAVSNAITRGLRWCYRKRLPHTVTVPAWKTGWRNGSRPPIRTENPAYTMRMVGLYPARACIVEHYMGEWHPVVPFVDGAAVKPLCWMSLAALCAMPWRPALANDCVDGMQYLVTNDAYKFRYATRSATQWTDAVSGEVLKSQELMWLPLPSAANRESVFLDSFHVKESSDAIQ